MGYRHFDTAKIYGNEAALGRVIQNSDIPREEFFITSKVWTTDLGYRATKKAFEQTCQKLNVTYLDMYLIHFAGPQYVNAWKAMEELYDSGKIKVIGVANFKIRHLEHLKKHSRISPMVNQIETHPEFPQHELHDYMVRHRILHEAWGPLGQEAKRCWSIRSWRQLPFAIRSRLPKSFCAGICNVELLSSPNHRILKGLKRTMKYSTLS